MSRQSPRNAVHQSPSIEQSQSHDANYDPSTIRPTVHRTPSREEVKEAEQKAASMCDLPHVDGAGCIKCTGVVSGLLRGLPEQKVQSQEFPTVPCPKNVETDEQGQVQKCNACTAGMAQHKVFVGEGATGPDAQKDPLQLCTCPDKEAKAQKFYGTEWAGRTAPDGTRVPQVAICEGPLGVPLHEPVMAEPSQ